MFLDQCRLLLLIIMSEYAFHFNIGVPLFVIFMKVLLFLVFLKEKCDFLSLGMVEYLRLFKIELEVRNPLEGVLGM